MTKKTEGLKKALNAEREKRKLYQQWFVVLNAKIAQTATEQLNSIEFFVETLPTVGHHLLPHCTEQQRAIDADLLLWQIQRELDRRQAGEIQYSRSKIYLAVGIDKYFLGI